MKASEIKIDIVKKIEGLNMHQLKEIYGLFQNYFNSTDSVEEWDKLNSGQKGKIKEGIKQADANMTKPIAEVTGRLRRKYGLNG